MSVFWPTLNTLPCQFSAQTFPTHYPLSNILRTLHIISYYVIIQVIQRTCCYNYQGNTMMEVKMHALESPSQITFGYNTHYTSKFNTKTNTYPSNKTMYLGVKKSATSLILTTMHKTKGRGPRLTAKWATRDCAACCHARRSEERADAKCGIQ